MSVSNELTLKVILDIYSGRPNPTWSLSRSPIKSLKKMLGKDYQELPRIRRRELPGLGYRGFIIINEDQLKGLPLALRVFDGTVTVRDFDAAEPSEVYAFKDRNRIEYWLLEQAAEQDLDEVIARFGGPSLHC